MLSFIKTSGRGIIEVAFFIAYKLWTSKVFSISLFWSLEQFQNWQTEMQLKTNSTMNYPAASRRGITSP